MKKEKSIVRIMLQSLAMAVVFGIAMIVLKKQLLQNGQEGIWNVIYSLLFADISKAGTKGLGIFYVIQTVFLNGLQLTIVPLVFTSLTLAVSSITEVKKLGRIAGKTALGFLLLYGLGCLFSGTMALTAVKTGVFKVIEGIVSDTSNIVEVESANPMSIITTMVPNNLTAAFSNNQGVLAVVFVAIIVGLCINQLGKKIPVFVNLVEEVNKIVEVCINLLINKAGPIAVFAMISRAFAIYGIERIRPIVVYILVTIAVLMVYLFLGYPLVIMATTKLNPIYFMKKIFKVGLFAFTTGSSAATLPINRKTNVEELGINEEVADFTLPLGMTINMNGTAIMHVIGTVFIATAAGFHVRVSDVVLMSLIAIAASAGTPAIPVAGSILLFTVLNGTGFINDSSLMIYSLILAVNKPVELFLTSLNVVGDACTALMVAHSEGELDTDMYYDHKTYVDTNTGNDCKAEIVSEAVNEAI